jgi:hypothetical protein
MLVIALIVNGEQREVDVPPDMPLLWVLQIPFHRMRIVVVLSGSLLRLALRNVCALESADIEALIRPAASGRLDALPVLEVVDQFPHQILESVRLKILEMHRPQSLRNSHQPPLVVTVLERAADALTVPTAAFRAL